MAFAIAGLFAVAVPGAAAAAPNTDRVPTAVWTVTAPTAANAASDVSPAQAPNCQIFSFGPALGAVGAFVEFDVVCNFASPFFTMNGTLTAGGILAAVNGVTCGGSTFCVLVVQSPGCASGFLYQGAMDGRIQFPDGSIIPFGGLAPPNAAGVVVC